MCGICGAIQVDGEPRPVLPVATLEAMTDVMAYRGPDDRGFHVADGVALGVRRLSIVDVEGGHQPFANETGDVYAIQNGELYNHLELRRELRADGHVLRSRCDTEVLPHLYERLGPAFPQRLRGDFGLAVWDARRRIAVLARDRAGVKPLYYARSGDVLLFASELKCLLASGLVAADLDHESVVVHLMFGYVPGPRTLLRDVAKLLPGERLVVEPGDVRVERYWRHPEHAPARRTRERDDDAYAGRLLEEVERATRLRLMSDVPLGAMLSGGLDSSLIVALMARNTAQPVRTFSVGFAEDGADNELAAAREVARRFGTEHREIELSFFQDTIDLEDLVWHLDEPVADLSALGFYALSRLASETVTVALSGQGADELLGGYRKHRAAALAGSWTRVPAVARRLAVAGAASGPPLARRMARTLGACDPVARQVAMSGHLDPAVAADLLAGPLRDVSVGASARAVAPYAEGIRGDPLPAALHLDSRLALVDDLLHYFDRMSMAHSLEIRVPYLDHHVIEYCASVPSNLKVRRGQTKHLLKRAARGLLPDDVLERRKLGLFRHSVSGWLQANAETRVRDYLLDGRPSCADLLDRRCLEQLVVGARGDGQLLLAILLLEIWLSSYLPRATAAARDAYAGRTT